MNLLGRLLGSGQAPAAPSSQHSVHASVAPESQTGSRRELLKVVLRETLERHGIPVNWISSEVMLSTSRTGEQRGVHWRLVIRHWDPLLLTHAVALQHSLLDCVMGFDPLASKWLTAISWQFALEDESACPPMPAPGTWRAAAGATAGMAVAQGAEHDRRRSDLEQMFSERDAEFDTPEGDGLPPGYEATHPSNIRTEPAQL